MCGIAGLVDRSGRRPLPSGVLQRMADALAHRGPDDEGYMERDDLGMVNRRLSIVGLSDGRQPIANEYGSVIAVFNGELFDYPEVKHSLETKGHRFRTHCDAELIPHLWEEYQDGMFERLRGQFALALYDAPRRRLILARDRFGIIPLYWSRQRDCDGGWRLFTSEIRGLLASQMVRPRPDLRGIDQVFHFFAVPGPATCFEDVRALVADCGGASITGRRAGCLLLERWGRLQRCDCDGCAHPRRADADVHRAGKQPTFRRESQGRDRRAAYRLASI